ncbi:MAG TPA: phosphoglycerate kinase, partial [Acidimicrobiales bacterium]|nr:phosphoglycerate kinase [Acidimicrobiales bacterium]
MDPLPSYDRWGSLKGKRILVRVDFNTPVAEVEGRLEVTDDFRIRAALPLFEELLSRGAVVVACTHFGRPKGRVVEKYGVEPVRRRLQELDVTTEFVQSPPHRLHPIALDHLAVGPTEVGAGHHHRAARQKLFE